ncbi:cyclophilin-like fold protein [Micromonospora sp. NPDC002717]|uniref:cyclophilin-like fold protein n=1 Tax=Micromonospora sp. NPDC002717 TaxID=3154424 RepID=UPI003327ED5D
MTTTDTPVRIVIGDVTLHAALWDNPAARSLLEQLPLTLEFSDYGGREVIAQPPQPIGMEGMPEEDCPVAGDLGYYAPSGVVSVHYSDIGCWNGSARLGRIDGDLSAVQGRSAPFIVTIERAD